ncbi:MAG TPA: prepilin-type N-terminal cleavage/methylation domain-containing protein [Vicinamibacteria bacterium]|nr:prepilin-type N-terminal cleavage/methylation domain-containing protein [Vicinamibacteria bacterium]
MEFAQKGGAMARHASLPNRRERGFSLIETLIVVVIIMIMAAVALPNIGQYIRNYRIKGAAQLVAGELNSARSRAIMSNTNLGVSFVVVDRDTFRFVQEDIEDTRAERLSGLKRLPTGVIFVPTALLDGGPTLRFLRLGGFCNPAATTTTCRTAVPVDKRYDPTESATLDTGSMDQPYIGAEAATGTIEIRVRETLTGLERTVRIAPGGRVLPQP